MEFIAVIGNIAPKRRKWCSQLLEIALKSKRSQSPAAATVVCDAQNCFENTARQTTFPASQLTMLSRIAQNRFEIKAIEQPPNRIPSAWLLSPAGWRAQKQAPSAPHKLHRAGFSTMPTEVHNHGAHIRANPDLRPLPDDNHARGPVVVVVIFELGSGPPSSQRAFSTDPGSQGGGSCSSAPRTAPGVPCVRKVGAHSKLH